MPNTKTETYYTACVRLKRVEGLNIDLTEDDDIGWLVLDCNYPQIHAGPGKLKEPPTLANYMAWNGMPWYCQIKEGTLQVFKHTVTTTTEAEEVQL